MAWKITGADQYSVWNTDSNGNYISDAIGVVSGSSSALESVETSFHQDLNGDGVVGSAPVQASDTPSVPVSEAAPVVVVSNDTSPHLQMTTATFLSDHRLYNERNLPTSMG